MAWCHSFCLFVYFLVQYIHSFHHIHTVHSSVTIRRSSSPPSHRWSAQWEKPPWGAEPRIKHGPALQKADALPTELTRTLPELRHTLTELRRTLTELRRNFAEPPRYIILYLKPPSFHIALMLRKCKGLHVHIYRTYCIHGGNMEQPYVCSPCPV